MLVRLDAHDMCLKLDPAAGGSVRAFNHRDLEILRPGPLRTSPAFDPLQFAAFPMVPFVGRIHHGVFNADGKEITLPPNLPPEPHAIHGQGWRDAWTIDSQTETSATLLYKHQADVWPWAYEARQVFSLETDAFCVDLSVKNLGQSPMPAGLGWHPYFHRKDAELKVPTRVVWTPNADTGENLPGRIPNQIDLIQTRKVETLNLDTTFSLAEPIMRISWPTHSVELVSDPLFHHATIYVPPGEDYFCAEPISHAPNSVNSDLSPDVTGQKWLAPGETLSGRIRLTIERS